MNNTTRNDSMEPTNNQSAIERAVMRRVHLIRILGLIISTITLAILTLILALWGIGKEVWVERVFQNAPEDFVRLPNFFINAFGNTRLVVQILTLLTFASFIYLARETVRALSSICKF